MPFLIPLRLYPSTSNAHYESAILYRFYYRSADRAEDITVGQCISTVFTDLWDAWVLAGAAAVEIDSLPASASLAVSVTSEFVTVSSGKILSAWTGAYFSATADVSIFPKMQNSDYALF